MADKSLDFENYRKYSSDPNPTTNADLQDYMSNQNKLTTELTEQLLWQPLTAYGVGDIIHSKNITAGKVARCTQAGTSGQTEPLWSATNTDGTCKWELIAESMTATQRAAMDSGITAEKVEQYDGYETGKQDVLSITQMNAVNSGATAAKIAKYEEYETTKASPTGTNFKGAEVVYDMGNETTIDLTKGRIFTVSSTMIWLPRPIAGVTITVVATVSNKIHWYATSSFIRWPNGIVPDIPADGRPCIFTFLATDTSYWYGFYGGGGFNSVQS